MGSNSVDITCNGILPRYYISSHINISIHSFFTGRITSGSGQTLNEIAKDYAAIFDVDLDYRSIVRIYTRVCNLKKDVKIKINYSYD